MNTDDPDSLMRRGGRAPTVPAVAGSSPSCTGMRTIVLIRREMAPRRA